MPGATGDMHAIMWEAMWLILQQDQPEDFVIATGVQHSVRDFVCAAAGQMGISIRWQGTGPDEEGLDARTGTRVVAIDPRDLRPAEVDNLLGNAMKAREMLGMDAYERPLRI